MIPDDRKNERQYTKLLTYQLADGDWVQDGAAFKHRAIPVYRKPQADWGAVDAATQQWIWFVPKAMGADNPESAGLPEWIRCYWDGQAGRWVIVGGGGASVSIVRFQFDSGYEEVHEYCADRVVSTLDHWKVKPVAVPCGGSATVPGVGADGYITIYDPLAWLADREAADLYGKQGYAAYMHLLTDPEGYETCRWEIQSINMFRNVINVTDVVDTGTTIDIYTEKQSVWDNCKLPIEQIETTTCEDPLEY